MTSSSNIPSFPRRRESNFQASAIENKLDPRLRGDDGFKRSDELRSIAASGTLNDEAVIWQLPEEVPVAIMINSKSHAVMMATPADLQDFAIGFALSEGLIAHASPISNHQSSIIFHQLFSLTALNIVIIKYLPVSLTPIILDIQDKSAVFVVVFYLYYAALLVVLHTTF